ncbi:MAG: phytanoyl-CoA dioxygenase family protein [Truepera sp.]|nr:phytanoyl-CoA dioxygenase family protein [Truepera sp.]
MRTEVAPERVAQFQKEGFIVIEGFLSSEELQTWRDVTEEAVQQRLASGDGLHNLDADDFYKNVFTQCLRLVDSHAGMKKLLTDPRLGRLAATLSGVDGVRLWHDQALFKQPYGNQTAWHRDVPYWAFHSRKSVSMWFALDDATVANGCLWYLPGTHLLGNYELTRIGSNMLDQFHAYPEWLEIEAVPAPCPAGSVVIHNAMIAHGASANMTPGVRRAMTSVYYPDGELYNGTPDTLPEVYYQNLKPGDRLDDDRYVPLIWHRDQDKGVPMA